MMPRLKELYNKKIKTNLKDKFGYKNIYMVPEIQKIVLNMGLGIDGNDSKILKTCEDDLSKISFYNKIKEFGFGIKSGIKSSGSSASGV